MLWNKQSRRRWFGDALMPMWRQCNELGLCCFTFRFRYTPSNDVSNKCERWSYHVLSRLTDYFHTEAWRKMFSQRIVYSCRKTLERDIRIEFAMKTCANVQYAKSIAQTFSFVEHLPRSFDGVIEVSDIRRSTPNMKTNVKRDTVQTGFFILWKN